MNKKRVSNSTSARVRALNFLLVFVAVTSNIAIAQPGPVQDPSVLVRQIKTLLAGLATNDDFSGVVLVAKDGTPISHRAYGFANRADGIRNTNDTRFNIASMGKMFTAVAIMQLAHEMMVLVQCQNQTAQQDSG